MKMDVTSNERDRSNREDSHDDNKNRDCNWNRTKACLLETTDVLRYMLNI